MTDWFRTDDIPGLEKLPITRHAAEILNEAENGGPEEMIQLIARAVIFGLDALETRQNQLLEALGATEGGLPPGEYDGARDIPAG